MLKLIMAILFGGLVGLERELHRRHAGLRTHILVCLGSALIMLTSLYVFDIYKDKAPLDPTRIAAGVVTGIGFLGAGTIIRSGEAVRGLTTAASIWVVAGIGLAIGCGFYEAAANATALVVIVLFLLRHFEKKFFKKEV
jgi:putative Mg2+ transporter-C (MgtC) family protein